MAITLSDDTTTITLPDDIWWGDEHTWHGVAQVAEPTITGGVLVQTGTYSAGRPITLMGDERHAWISAATLAQLKAFAAVPGKTMTLVIRNVAHTVVFAHHDAPALEVSHVADFSPENPDANQWYFVTLKFMEI